MTVENTSKKSTIVSILAVVCIFYGFLIIDITALRWILIEFLTPFMMGPLMLLLWAGLAGLILAAIVYFVAQLKKNLMRAVLPLLITGVTFAILWWVPFTAIWLDIEFRLNYRPYNKIVEMVEDGRIQSDDLGRARLPSGYRYISRGGDIIVEKGDGVTSVFFYTYRGVLDNFSGYMYRSDDTPPPCDFMAGDWFQIERKRPHWFFCASR